MISRAAPGGRAYDVVILGSGFASYEIARQSLMRGSSVLIIEKGTADPANADPVLSTVTYRREPIVSGGVEFGAQVPLGFESAPRYVGLGGTSELWSGKWRRLDPIDLQRSVAGRRWPISYDELDVAYDRVAADYGWPDWSGDTAYAGCRERVTAHGLRVVEMYEENPPMRLRPKWPALLQLGALEVIDEAQLAGAEADANGSLERLSVRRRRDEITVDASRFVVACGAIESVRVITWLRVATGMGRTARIYGGFMDHPKAFVGEIVPNASHLSLLEYLHRARSESKRLLAFGLPPDELALDHGGNHTVFVWPSASQRAGEPMRMVINLEQFPEPHNTIAADPAPVVTWRVSRRTRTDAEAFLADLVPRLARLVGSIHLTPSPSFRGASHPAGVLPMANGPEAHVDPHCRVRDFANVYCVSSAVFPVAGSANPTMTIVALARRLADHLHRVDPA